MDNDGDVNVGTAGSLGLIQHQRKKKCRMMRIRKQTTDILTQSRSLLAAPTVINYHRVVRRWTIIIYLQVKNSSKKDASMGGSWLMISVWLPIKCSTACESIMFFVKNFAFLGKKKCKLSKKVQS